MALRRCLCDTPICLGIIALSKIIKQSWKIQKYPPAIIQVGSHPKASQNDTLSDLKTTKDEKNVLSLHQLEISTRNVQANRISMDLKRFKDEKLS